MSPSAFSPANPCRIKGSASLSLRYGMAVIRLHLVSEEPTGNLAIKQPSDLVRLAIFGAAGVVIARLSDTLRHAESDRSQLASIVESSDDAIVGKDLTGVITSWNGGAEQLFGYPASEAIGRSISLIIPPERRSEEDDVIRQIRSGRRVEHFDTVRRRKDGSEVEVSPATSRIGGG